jgi:hypothetical protein
VTDLEEGFMTPDEFFASQALSKQLFEAVRREVETLGKTSMRVTKSQVAFRRRRGFAWVWMPGQYLKRETAPLVLTLSLPQRDKSPRWKEIVEPYPGRFTHHLELYDLAEIDDEVRGWFREAWEAGA